MCSCARKQMKYSLFIYFQLKFIYILFNYSISILYSNNLLLNDPHHIYLTVYLHKFSFVSCLLQSPLKSDNLSLSISEGWAW